jgi:hypothetical protein
MKNNIRAVFYMGYNPLEALVVKGFWLVCYFVNCYFIRGGGGGRGE